MGMNPWKLAVTTAVTSARSDDGDSEKDLLTFGENIANGWRES